MPDRSLTCSNKRDTRFLLNSHGFTDFQEFSTCSAAWTRATWTARRSGNCSAWGTAAPALMAGLLGIRAGNAAAIARQALIERDGKTAASGSAPPPPRRHEIDRTHRGKPPSYSPPAAVDRVPLPPRTWRRTCWNCPRLWSTTGVLLS